MPRKAKTLEPHEVMEIDETEIFMDTARILIVDPCYLPWSDQPQSEFVPAALKSYAGLCAAHEKMIPHSPPNVPGFFKPRAAGVPRLLRIGRPGEQLWKKIPSVLPFAAMIETGHDGSLCCRLVRDPMTGVATKVVIDL